MAPYFGSVSYMRANNFAEFKRAMLHWGAPTENQVYADVKGNIGWVPGGLAPIRPNWDGLMPVPGDGRYEWAGFWPGDKLPSSYNPASGYVTTSNEMNLPADYPYQERKLGFEWTNGSRHARIDEVLKSLPKSSIEDSMKLQNDVHLDSRAAAGGIARSASHAAIQKLQPRSIYCAAGTLANFRSQPQAALMEVWISRHLERAFIDAVLPAERRARHRGAGYGRDARHAGKARRCSETVTRLYCSATLAAAYEEMEKLEGADPKAWQWGKLHHSLPEHPLLQAVDGEMLASPSARTFPDARRPVHAECIRVIA